MDRNSKILEMKFSVDVEHSIIQQSIVDITHYIKNTLKNMQTKYIQKQGSNMM